MLLLVAVLATTGAVPGAARDLIAQGRALLAANQPVAAREVLEQAVREAPRDALPAFLLGTAYEAAGGGLTSALAAHREALRRDPGFAPAHDHLGVLLEGLRQPIEAEAELRAAIAADPTLAEAHHHLGLLLQSLIGRSQEALAPLREAARLAPAEARFRRVLGIALHAAGELGPAQTELREATRLSRADATAWTELGLVLVEQRRVREARVVLERAVAVDPSEARAWRLLGKLALARGDRAGGLRALARARSLAPSDPASAAELCESEAAARVPSASSALDCRAATALRPRDVTLRLTTARLLARAGDCGAAQEEVAALDQIPLANPGHLREGQGLLAACRPTGR